MQEKKATQVGIIAAMQSEIDALKAQITDARTVTISGITYLEGELFGSHVVAAQCGIGKVFAAICAQTMILTWQPEMVINIGVAGALSPTLRVGDIAVSRDVVQHDMDASSIGIPVGTLCGIRGQDLTYLPAGASITQGLLDAAVRQGRHAEAGTIASGDVFVSDSALKQRIVSRFGAIACDMEGGAIAHVCCVNETPFCVLRAMSDSGDENAADSFSMTLDEASDAAMGVMEAFLQTLQPVRA